MWTPGLDCPGMPRIRRIARVVGTRPRTDPWPREFDRLRLEYAMKVARLVVWTWDMRTDEVHMTDEGRAIAGLPADHTTTAQTFALMHPDDVAPSYERAERVRAGVPDELIEFRLPDGQGGWRWFVGRATRFGDDDAPFVVGVCYDDTDRRE